LLPILALPKKLVAYCILVYAWFVAKILAVNGYLFISLTDSCQIFGQVWAEDSLAKILASQFLPTFCRARLGINQTCPESHLFHLIFVAKCAYPHHEHARAVGVPPSGSQEKFFRIEHP
jgi:hypothetical protein